MPASEPLLVVISADEQDFAGLQLAPASSTPIRSGSAISYLLIGEFFDP